ncbi:MAG: TrmH family RNA methyltransferase [bacterium]
MIIILDNVRSIFNVGAIFRTADSVGADAIMLGGYTPTPPNDKLLKTSLGALDYVEWKTFNNEELLKQLVFMKENGIRIISVEQTPKSICYTEASNSKQLTWNDTAYVFGNEIVGVKEEILNLSDLIIDIPMHGKKNSLNVSVTVGIISYEANRFKQ